MAELTIYYCAAECGCSGWKEWSTTWQKLVGSGHQRRKDVYPKRFPRRTKTVLLPSKYSMIRIYLDSKAPSTKSNNSTQGNRIGTARERERVTRKNGCKVVQNTDKTDRECSVGQNMDIVWEWFGIEPCTWPSETRWIELVSLCNRLGNHPHAFMLRIHYSFNRVYCKFKLLCHILKSRW